MNKNKIIRVLIVDDSAYIRKVIKKMLSRSPFLEVIGTAYDGEEALEMVERSNPDVITLDMVMPQMDGLTFLRQQMSKKPVRVVIVSITSESSERVLEALLRNDLLGCVQDPRQRLLAASLPGRAHPTQGVVALARRLTRRTRFLARVGHLGLPGWILELKSEFLFCL